MPTHYLLSDTARASLETDFGSRVEDYADRVRTHDADMPYRYGMIYPDDARRYRDEELSPSSWYAALCASAPDLAGRYARMAEGILSRSSGDVPSWTVRRPE